MMGQSTNTFAPPYAARCWVDGRDLYFELSGANGPSVLCFPRDSFGFAKALATLFVAYSTEGHGEVYLRPPLPSPPDSSGLTDAHRQAARDVLRKMKII